MKKIIVLLMLGVYALGCMSGSEGNVNEGVKPVEKAPPKSTVKTMKEPVKTMQEKVAQKAVDLVAAIASGSAYECTYTVKGAKSQTLVKGDKHLSTVEVQGMKMNTVSDGEWAYVWNSGDKTGIKFNIQDADEGQAGETEYQDISEVAETALNVECHPSIATDESFIPPASIVFTDMNEKLEEMQEMADKMQTAQGTQDPCSMCEMIPDTDSRQQCMENC
ncbi:hypothetical protein ACFLRF_05680 [Candidatus Altiarchaeota archaeon]